MSADTPELAICFADICDSTRLFEQLGDDRARDLVGRVFTVLTDVVQEYEGRVVKTIGDEVMGSFPDLMPAVSAVTQMPRVVREDETLAEYGIKIRVGMCHGRVLLEEDGDVYGDAVNTASRLVDWARPHQVVTTASVLESLPDFFQTRTRNLGETTLAGKEEPVEIIELLGQENESESELTVVGGRPETPDPDDEERKVLWLRHGERTIQVRDERIVIGRSDQSDLTVKDSRVSRTHGLIEYRDGSFVYEDNSTNGTYAQIGDDDILFLHREQLRLHGSGHLSLGRKISTDGADPVRFTCESAVSA
jgi:class 3 adenylate cyclase